MRTAPQRTRDDPGTAELKERRRRTGNHLERWADAANFLAKTARCLPLRDLPDGALQAGKAATPAGRALAGRSATPGTRLDAAGGELRLRHFLQRRPQLRNLFARAVAATG